MLPKPPSTKGPAEMFTGDVWFDVIARGEAPSRVRVNTVRFAPCARTAWDDDATGGAYVTDEEYGTRQLPRRVIRTRGDQLLITTSSYDSRTRL